MVVVEARYASNNDGDDDCGAVVAIAEPKFLKIVVTIVYGKPKKLLVESRTMSLSLRRFVALPKNCASRLSTTTSPR